MTWSHRQVFWRWFISLVKFNYWPKFHVSNITGSEVMTISFIGDWPKIWKLKIPSSEFCSISGHWKMLWIPNLAWMSRIKFYCMLQNVIVTAFTVSELLRKNQQRVKLPLPSRPKLYKSEMENLFFCALSLTFAWSLIRVFFSNTHLLILSPSES